MKKIALTVLCALLVTNSVAAAQDETQEEGQEESQEETLMSHGIESGGFGVPVVKFSDIGGDFAEFGYGGLELEYINRSNKVVHFSIYTLVGGGGVVFLFDRTDAVFVLEPAINLELNVAKFFRIGAGGGYRFVAGADLDLANGDLSAPVGVLTFKFGSF